MQHFIKDIFCIPYNPLRNSVRRSAVSILDLLTSGPEETCEVP